MTARKRKVLKLFTIAVAIGCMYTLFVKYTGFAIPCIFYVITDLKCPGCGVTRMCLSLLQLDFVTAFSYNQMLFMLMPVLIFLFGRYTFDYVKGGRWVLAKSSSALLYVCIGLLLLFAVYRNMIGL
jgi:hypothetical protein